MEEFEFLDVGKGAILMGTLVYQIIVQDGINVQAGKFPKINKVCRME